jgi:hypothetical protein
MSDKTVKKLQEVEKGEARCYIFAAAKDVGGVGSDGKDLKRCKRKWFLLDRSFFMTSHPQSLHIWSFTSFYSYVDLPSMLAFLAA